MSNGQGRSCVLWFSIARQLPVAASRNAASCCVASIEEAETSGKFGVAREQPPFVIAGFESGSVLLARWWGRAFHGTPKTGS